MARKPLIPVTLLNEAIGGPQFADHEFSETATKRWMRTMPSCLLRRLTNDEKIAIVQAWQTKEVARLDYRAALERVRFKKEALNG